MKTEPLLHHPPILAILVLRREPGRMRVPKLSSTVGALLLADRVLATRFALSEKPHFYSLVKAIAAFSSLACRVAATTAFFKASSAIR